MYLCHSYSSDCQEYNQMKRCISINNFFFLVNEFQDPGEVRGTKIIIQGQVNYLLYLYIAMIVAIIQKKNSDFFIYTPNYTNGTSIKTSAFKKQL